MSDVSPIVGPLLALLKSRKFVVSVVTLVLDVVITLLPSLESVRTELLAVFTAVGVALVSSIAYEDGKEKSA